jgi:hypothetical protein
VHGAHSKRSYRSYRDGVTDLVDGGEPFGEVEQAIELAHLEQDEKAALWLFAFSKRDLVDRDPDGRSPLAAVADE